MICIWLVAHESMIYLSEDIFGDDVLWDGKAMLACGWEASLISSANNSLRTSSIKDRGLQCKNEPHQFSESLHKAIRNGTIHCDSLRVIYGAKTLNFAGSFNASWSYRVVITK